MKMGHSSVRQVGHCEGGLNLLAGLTAVKPEGLIFRSSNDCVSEVVKAYSGDVSWERWPGR